MFSDSSHDNVECPFQAFLRDTKNEKETGDFDKKGKRVYPPVCEKDQKTGGQTPMNCALSITNAEVIFKTVMANPGMMFELLRIDMRHACEQAVSELIKAELSDYLGRDKYERLSGCSSGEVNYRNGYYERSYTAKGIGTLNIQVARDRLSKFQSRCLEKYERKEQSLEQDIVLLYLTGLSTRSLSLVSEKLLGRKISASEVSRLNKKLLTGMEEWRLRDLHGVKIKYMYVDGVFFDMRVGDSVEKVAILVVIGVKEDGEKMFLAIQQGDKESSATWREVFKDLKGRGLDHTCVRLGIMDGLAGLERVFREEFPYAKIQRCQVHVKYNVLAKVPYKMKTEIGDHLRDIFYASGKEKALENYNRFVSEYEQLIPSAVKSLRSSIESCLTFFSFPREEWASLRTTNVIERVNKEFKRRTKPMEIVAGEAAAYRLLCFIALKMEGYWSHNAKIKRKYTSAIPEFTQNT